MPHVLRRAAPLAAALLLAAVPAQAKWSTISNFAYNGGMVCRDGASFDFASWVNQTNKPPAEPPMDTRLVVTRAAPGQGEPPPQPTTTVSPDPLPAGGFPMVAFDRHLTVPYNPERQNFGTFDAWLVHNSAFVAGWRSNLAVNTRVRFMFGYPDPENIVVDPGAGSSVIKVADCLLPRIQVRNGGNQAIDPDGNGLIAVTVLSNPKFKADTVKPPTLRFGDDDHRTPVQSFQRLDFNGDGRRDLKLQFQLADAGFECGDTRALLTGAAAKRFAAEAPIHTVGC